MRTINNNEDIRTKMYIPNNIGVKTIEEFLMLVPFVDQLEELSGSTHYEFRVVAVLKDGRKMELEHQHTTRHATDGGVVQIGETPPIIRKQISHMDVMGLEVRCEHYCTYEHNLHDYCGWFYLPADKFGFFEPSTERKQISCINCGHTTGENLREIDGVFIVDCLSCGMDNEVTSFETYDVAEQHVVGSNAMKMAEYHRQHCDDPDCDISLFLFGRLMEMAGLPLNKEDKAKLR